MIRQVWGPAVDLVGGGGYRAWTIGSWFVMKYSNIVMYALVALLFLVGMLVDLPGHEDDR